MWKREDSLACTHGILATDRARERRERLIKQFRRKRKNGELSAKNLLRLSEPEEKRRRMRINPSKHIGVMSKARRHKGEINLNSSLVVGEPGEAHSLEG